MLFMSSQEQNLTVRRLLLDQALRLLRLTLEHGLVSDHHFGAMLKNALERFVHSSSFHDHTYVGMVLQQTPQALPQQEQVVHQGTANGSISWDLCVRAHRYSLSARAS